MPSPQCSSFKFSFIPNVELEIKKTEEFLLLVYKNKMKELTKSAVDPTSRTVAIHKVGHYCRRTFLSGEH